MAERITGNRCVGLAAREATGATGRANGEISHDEIVWTPVRRALIALGLGIFAVGPAWAGENPKVPAEIMAIARSQWAAEVSGKTVDEQMNSVADDYTEFNPTWPTRIDGKAAALSLDSATSTNEGARSIVGDMLNPKVQVYGDTAILTYQLRGDTCARGTAS